MSPTSRITSLLLALLAGAALAAAAAAAANGRAKHGALGFLTPPSATEFARLVLVSAAPAQAASVRLENVNCVRAISRRLHVLVRRDLAVQSA
jgi:hypothetical protein